MYKNNLIFYPLKINNKIYYGFVDTGGGQTFLFRKKELLKYIKETNKYLEDSQLNNYPNKVILFIGQDFFKNKIVEFNYKKKEINFINKIPKNIKKYEMIKSKKTNFIHVDILFENKKETFLFDTGATNIRNKKQYGISFLDGIIFDKLLKKYKVIKNYGDDKSPIIIIPEITIFDKKIKNVKFLRRHNNAFLNWMSNITKVKHIGAIGGNVLKNFNIICDYKNVNYYI